MRIRLNKRALLWKVAPILLSAIALSGCATLGSPTPEQKVQQRAEAFWQARLRGQPEQAYSLLSPAYRQVRTLEQYRAQYGAAAAVKAASVVNVTCEAEKCAVRIKIEAAPALMGVNVGTIVTGLDETWLLEDGQWWRFQSL